MNWRSGLYGAGAVLAAAAMPAGGHAAAGGEQSYADLQQAVLDGRDIRVTLDLSACHVHGSALAGPPVRGSLRFDAYMIAGDGSIAFSMRHFTVQDGTTPVDELLTFKVDPTGRIDAHSRFFNAATFTVVRESEFDCEIGRGASFHW